MSRSRVESAFAQATEVAMREWAGIETVPVGSGPPGSGLAARMLLIGGGLLALVMEPEQAEELTYRCLRIRDGDCVKDCLGETLNLIAGQAKTLLAGTPEHFFLGTPLVGEARDLPTSGFWLRFDSDLGPMALLVALPESAG